MAVEPRARFAVSTAALALCGVLALAFGGCTGLIRSDGDPAADGDGGAGDAGGDQADGCLPPPSLEGPVASPRFSAARGLVDQPFDLVITAAEGAEVSYTLDGSVPDEAHGVRGPSPVALRIEGTSVLRARALSGGQASRVATQTFLFVDQILDQPASADGFPQLELPSYPSGVQTLDHEMDPSIVDEDRALAGSALRAIPSVSIAMDPAELAGPEGIYAAGGSGQNREWERAASFEILHPDRPERDLQVDAAIRPHTHVMVKRSFKLLFKKEYGPGKLQTCLLRDAPLNGDSATTRFDSLILRGGTNRSLHHWCNPDDSAYIEDQWMHDSQIAMSGVGARGAYVHVFLNGLYFGLYNAMERPDDSFAAAYLGGDKQDWFSINHGGPVDGDPARWDYLTQTLIGKDMADPANYEQLTQYLDVEGFIDYLLVNWFAGTTDWPENNWYGAVRNLPPGPVRFFVWDADEVWDGRCQGPGDPVPDHYGAWVKPDFRADADGGGLAIAEIWHSARRSPAFMQLFVERVDRHFRGDGALTEAASLARWDALAAHVETPIVAEAARWGDSRLSFGEPRRTRETVWRPTVDRMRDERIPGNVARFIAALEAEGYYP